MDTADIPGWMAEIAHDRLVRWVRGYLQLGWPVALGSRPVEKGCSCGRPRCPEPGAHPVSPPSTSEAEVTRWVRDDPNANLLVATGGPVCAFDVPAARAGPLATGPRLGPVAALGDSYAVFVRAGQVPRYAQGSWRGPGRYVLVPPSALASGHTASWILSPTLPLPEAAPVAAWLFWRGT